MTRTSLRAEQNFQGFTLIEIMVVVIIIAALAAMIVPRLSGRSEQAKAAIAKADVSSSIATALKLYDLDNSQFPATEQGLSALLAKPNGVLNWNGPYLENKPIDPWGRMYQYKYPGEHNRLSYDLYSLGKDGSDGTEDDVRNWE
ncbi:MAG: type II secretion system major pseudopilin GspG [Candidatus Omnitrophota bacterium]